jgi:hypothetical protein
MQLHHQLNSLIRSRESTRLMQCTAVKHESMLEDKWREENRTASMLNLVMAHARFRAHGTKNISLQMHRAIFVLFQDTSAEKRSSGDGARLVDYLELVLERRSGMAGTIMTQ